MTPGSSQPWQASDGVKRRTLLKALAAGGGAVVAAPAIS
jgi:hypothetical protein